MPLIKLNTTVRTSATLFIRSKMAPSKTALLKVVEKFRAPAALYQPSKNAGDGWVEVSGIRRGGEVIIQLQEDAKRKGEPITVVRYQFRHGKDFLNARIMPGLPIERKGRFGFVFKSSSSNSGGYDIKTVSCVKFKCKDDADDFMMWWLAKNGSIETLLPRAKNLKVLCDSTNHLKRKAGEIGEDPTEAVVPPMKKLCKETEKHFNDNDPKQSRAFPQSNVDQERSGEVRKGDRSDNESKAVDSGKDSGKKAELVEEKDDSTDDIKDEDVEVLIHGGYGAHSQDWESAFLLLEDVENNY